MADGVLKDAPASWISDDNGTHMNSLGSATTGLRVLVQRTNEAKNYSDQMSSVRQEAEVLSTNLAIASEARSWSQIEKLVDKTHTLANTVSDISDSLAKDLDQLVRSVVGVAETIEQANERYVSCIDRLLSWENLLESFHRHRGDLLGHINAVRPAASTLGTDIRRLFENYQKQRKTITEKRDSLDGVGESTQALAKTASEMLSLIQKVQTPSKAPAAVTRNLAERQQALETAIRDLTSLAAQEGIHSLTPDASEILDRIRSVAEEARKRIMNDPEAKA
jgi:chromosome segregation ATPase